MSEFGDFVARRRRALGLTQAELASRSGLSPGTIGDIEQGKQYQTRNIDLLAKALDLSADSLRRRKLPPSDNVAPSLTLDQRERALIEKFRALSTKDKQRVEDFLSGIKPSRRGPKAVPQLAASERHQKTAMGGR